MLQPKAQIVSSAFTPHPFKLQFTDHFSLLLSFQQNAIRGSTRLFPILNCLGVFYHTDMGPRLTRRRLTLLPNAIRKMALLPAACGEKKLTTSSS